MKKILAALLGLTLAFTLTACGGNDQPAEAPQGESDQVTQSAEDPALTQLRQEMAQAGSDFAVAFLGLWPEDGSVDTLLSQSGCLEDYPFLSDAPLIKHEGYQAFCLIPRSADTTVTVEEYLCDESNNYQGEVGETLSEDIGQPVILVCNYNDVLPNLVVTLTEADGTSISYSPVLELCGGTVFVPADLTILDISDYQAITPQETPAPSVDLTGTWRAYEDFDGSQIVLEIIFTEDGTAEYLCGYAYSEFLSDYQGTWYTITDNGTYPAGSVLLEMTDALSGEEFFGVYTVTAESGTITLTHVSGDPLLHGWDGENITFSPATN